MPKTTSYDVSRGEVDQFVEGNEVVAAWVGRYVDAYENAHRLCSLFEWLRVVKGVEVSPKGFLNELVRLRGSRDVEKRQRYLRLVFEHTKFNPNFKDFGGSTETLWNFGWVT